MVGKKISRDVGDIRVTNQTTTVEQQAVWTIKVT